MLGERYDSDAGRATAVRAMQTIRQAAYRTSVALAEEEGAFPAFDAPAYLCSPALEGLDEDILVGIARHGIRNSHLTAIAPAGTISLLANNVSSGIEPVFAYRCERRMRTLDGGWEAYTLEDHACRVWRTLHADAPFDGAFVTATQLSASDHLAMQAALQPCVDNAISKTINVPETLPFDAFESIYRDAFRLGLKGCTTFRPNPVTGTLLSDADARADRHCCTIDREAD